MHKITSAKLQPGDRISVATDKDDTGKPTEEPNGYILDNPDPKHSVIKTVASTEATPRNTRTVRFTDGTAGNYASAQTHPIHPGDPGKAPGAETHLPHSKRFFIHDRAKSEASSLTSFSAINKRFSIVDRHTNLPVDEASSAYEARQALAEWKSGVNDHLLPDLGKAETSRIEPTQTWYHGVQESGLEGKIAHIREHGLATPPGVSPAGWPMLTDSLDQAKRYAGEHGKVIEYHLPTRLANYREPGALLWPANEHGAYGFDAHAVAPKIPISEKYIAKIHDVTPPSPSATIAARRNRGDVNVPIPDMPDKSSERIQTQIGMHQKIIDAANKHLQNPNLRAKDIAASEQAIEKAQASIDRLRSEHAHGYEGVSTPTVVEPRNHQGDTPVSSSVASVLDKWVQLRGSGNLSPDEVASLKDGIKRYGQTVPSVLYRGSNEQHPTYPVGKTVTLGPSSFSTDSNSAIPYAENGDGTPVMFHLRGRNDDVTGLSVANRAEAKSGYSEKEWITQGRFYVQNSRTDADGVVHVTLGKRQP